MPDLEREPSAPVEGVATRTVKGSAWLYFRHLLTSLVSVFVIAILARQLAPADFGLVALAAVAVRFTAIIGSGGVGSYVIYDRAEGREERVHAAFWLNLCGTLVTCAIGFAILPFLTRFYNMPGLGGVTAAFLIAFFLSQFILVPESLIKRSLDYRKAVIRDTCVEIAVSVLAISMALLGYGVWSLVLPNLILAPVRIVLSFRLARWTPRLPLRVNHWPRIFNFSGNAIVSDAANAIASEGDTLLIGKTLGGGLLGIYNMAWTTANIVNRNVSGVVGKIAMPALSAIAADEARLKAGIKRMLRMLAIASFPLVVGMFVLAEEFILTLYGPKWIDCVLPVRILLIFSLRRAVGSPVTSLYDVMGRPDIGMKLAVVFIPFYLGSIWVGSAWGIVGIAAAVTIVRTLHGFLQFEVAARLLREPMRELLRPLSPVLSSSLLMGAVVYAAKLGLDSLFDLPAALGLIVLTAVGAVTYLVLLRTAYRELARDVLDLVPSRKHPVRIRLEQLFGVAGG